MKSIARRNKSVSSSRPNLLRLPFTVERLEAREVPAGIVTAVSAKGTLTITGLDDLSAGGALAGLNDQEVTITGTGAAAFDVEVLNGTEFQGTAITKMSFSGVNAIKLDMRQGNDSVGVNNANLSGDLLFLGGGGDDTLTMGDATGNQSFGSVTVTNGDGDDGFAIGNGVNTIAGKLTINNGIGNSTVLLNIFAGDKLPVGDLIVTNTDGFDNLVVSGAVFSAKSVTISNGNGGSNTAGVSIKTGNGDNSVTIQAIVQMAVGGAIAIENGNGDALYTIGDAASTLTAKSLSLKNGNGTGSTTVDGKVTIGTVKTPGSIAVTNLDGANSFDVFAKLTVNGSVTINNGAGGSVTTFQGASTLISGALSITNLDGDDLFFTGGSGSFQVIGAVTINNGVGDGVAGSSTNISAQTSSFGGNFTVKAANGDDFVQFHGGITSKAITLDLGDGFSQIEFFSATDIFGNLSISTGGGDDFISVVSTLNVTGMVTIKTNAGNDSVAWDSPSTITGAVAIQTGQGAVEQIVADLRNATWQPAEPVGAGSEYWAELDVTRHASALTFGDSLVHASLIVAA